jgi:hypothetical protein
MVCDEMSGAFTNWQPVSPPNNFEVFNFNSATLSENTLNITDFQFDYRADIKTVYTQLDSGASNFNPYRVVFGPKEISANFTSDSTNLKLSYTGELYSLSISCKNASQTISENYSISGFINRKNFSVSESNISQTSYSITQSHLGQTPKIDSLDISTYPTNNYIEIYSPNNTTNGFLNEINNDSLINRVILGDRELRFDISRGVSFDTLTSYIDNNSVNGKLQVQSTNGIITYPSPLTLNFPQTVVSGFYPRSGNFGDVITISGSNFNRIDAVLFNGMNSNFKVSINNTGSLHTLQAAIPQNAVVGKITVLSTLRNRSGVSNDVFYPQGLIYGFNPITGIWGNTITISGLNFSGVSGLFFNNIPSPSFKVLTNNLITGQVPLTGAGYTKGYVTLSGINGITQSYNYYKPHFPVSGISTISGTIAEDMALYCNVVDTGFLCPTGGGYKVSFGNTVKGVFYKSGSNTLTGLIPSGYFDGQRIFLYEPDGVTTYIPYTGRIQQVGPAPFVGVSIPRSVERLAMMDFQINGNYFKDFFGLGWYVSIQGSGFTGYYNRPQFENNSFYNSINLTGVVITGGTGFYSVIVRNFVGTGMFTGLVVTEAINRARTDAVITKNSTSTYSPLNAVNGIYNSNTDYYATNATNTNRGVWWKASFNNLYDIREVKLYLDNLPSTINIGGVQRNKQITGYVEFLDAGNSPLYGYNTGILLSGYHLRRYNNPITGVKHIIIYNTGSSDLRTMAFNEVEVFGSPKRTHGFI